MLISTVTSPVMPARIAARGYSGCGVRTPTGVLLRAGAGGGVAATGAGVGAGVVAAGVVGRGCGCGCAGAGVVSAGDNAMEYYLALREKSETPDASAESALIDLMPYAIIAAEQAIGREDFVEAERLRALIEKTDAQAPALPRI